MSRVRLLLATAAVVLAVSPAGASELARLRRSFVPPVSGMTLSSPFGPRGGARHKGVDLAAPAGTTIKAAWAGTARVGWSAHGGFMVILTHPQGLTTRYLHLGFVSVRSGQRVKAGEKIGEVGNTGRVRGASGGYHCHFEVRVRGRAYDPELFWDSQTDIAMRNP